jgi:hypothetical protein
MARELSDVVVERGSVGTGERIRFTSHFPTTNFTLSLDVEAKRVQVNSDDLREVRSLRDFRSGTFLVERRQTFVAFELHSGETKIVMALQ